MRAAAVRVEHVGPVPQPQDEPGRRGRRPRPAAGVLGRGRRRRRWVEHGLERRPGQAQLAPQVVDREAGVRPQLRLGPVRLAARSSRHEAGAVVSRHGSGRPVRSGDVAGRRPPAHRSARPAPRRARPAPPSAAAPPARRQGRAAVVGRGSAPRARRRPASGASVQRGSAVAPPTVEHGAPVRPSGPRRTVAVDISTPSPAAVPSSRSAAARRPARCRGTRPAPVGGQVRLQAGSSEESAPAGCRGRRRPRGCRRRGGVRRRPRRRGGGGCPVSRARAALRVDPVRRHLRAGLPPHRSRGGTSSPFMRNESGASTAPSPIVTP